MSTGQIDGESALGAFVDADNPWPGLASFQEQDGAFFKGRDEEVAELRRTVQSQRLTVLFGASGLGKTSLLRAGLFPELRERDELPVYLRLSYEGTPRNLTEDVLLELLREAERHQVDASVRRGGESLWEYLHRRDSALWSPRNRLLMPVLVFDQFEELFSRAAERPGWAPQLRQFIEDLSDLAEGRPPEALKTRLEHEVETSRDFDFTRHRYRVVLSLREDYLAFLEELRERMPSIGRGHCRLLPMAGTQALQVAGLTEGRLVEPAVARLIVRFAAGADMDTDHPPIEELRVDPSLLSLFCRELNERRKAESAAQISERLVRESQTNIIERFYQQCMSGVSPAVRRFVEDELLTAQGHRDSRAYEDALLRPGVTADAIDRLVNARLLRAEERGGARRIELSHDVLTPVARTGRDLRAEQERIEAQQAAERERLQRERETSERERLAREAELARRETELAREKAARGEARSRRLMLLIGGLSIVAVALVGTTWWASREANRADTERAKALAESHNARTLLSQLEDQNQALSDALAGLEQAKANAAKALQSLKEQKQSNADTTQAERYLESAHQDARVAVAKAAAALKPRVYIHIRAEKDRVAAERLGLLLAKQVGVAFKGVELVSTGPNTNEVRYFRRHERKDADLIAAGLRDLGIQPVDVNYIAGYENATNIPPLHYEIWFGPGTRVGP
jgi:hypothetical protein